MADEFDFSQLEKFAQRFQSMYNEFDTFIKQFLLEQALRVIAKVKPRTPVDTGALRAMWGIGSQNIVTKEVGDGSVVFDPERSTIASIDLVGSDFQVVIWNGMDYASFIEFGARNPDGSWREGYFMMTISVNEVEQQMPLRFQKAFAQFLASKGVG